MDFAEGVGAVSRPYRCVGGVFGGGLVEEVDGGSSLLFVCVLKQEVRSWLLGGIFML